jgi:hypothetical protein
MSIVAAIAVAGLAILFLIVRVDNDRSTVLPDPTGPFTVARTSLVLSDSHATEAMAPINGSTRRLYMWVWYPRSG